MHYKNFVLYLTCFFLNCKYQEKDPFIVKNLDEKISGDWVVGKTNRYDFTLRKFSFVGDDSCHVYRFKKPVFFMIKMNQVIPVVMH